MSNILQDLTGEELELMLELDELYESETLILADKKALKFEFDQEKEVLMDMDRANLEEIVAVKEDLYANRILQLCVTPVRWGWW